MERSVWKKVCGLVLGIACLGLAGCGSDAGAPNPVEEPVVQEGALPPGMLEMGRWQGHWNSATQELKFTLLESEKPSFDLGTQPQGFARVAENTMTFSTSWAVVSSQSNAYGCNPVSGVHRLCAEVIVSNDTSRRLNQVYAEIDTLSPTGYEGVNSVAPPPGYPLSAQRGLWSYSDLVPSGGDVQRWEFALPGSEDFTFTVRVLATFLRTDYSLTQGAMTNNSAAGNDPWPGESGAPAWRNACQMGGSTASPIAMAFPYTLYDRTFSTASAQMVLGPMGMGLFPISGAPTSLPSPTQAYNLFPFWDDDLRLRNSVCHAVEGVMPNRRFVATWENAYLVGVPDSNLTFSVVLFETTDTVFFLYHRWSATQTDCMALDTRLMGGQATAGLQGFGVARQASPPTSPFLDVHLPECPGEGYFMKFSGTPTNNSF